MQRTVLNLVVWPYLAKCRPLIPSPHTDPFSITTSQARPYDTFTQSTSAQTPPSWSPPFPSTSSSTLLDHETTSEYSDVAGSSRRRSAGLSAREYLGLGPQESNSAYAESSAMALKRILEIHERFLHQPVPSSVESQSPSLRNIAPAVVSKPASARTRSKGKYEKHAIGTNEPHPSSRPLPDQLPTMKSTTSTQPTLGIHLDSTALDTYKPPTSSSSTLPLIIEKQLKARLFKLSVYTVLRTPEYLLNPTLVASLAETLEGRGAGKLANQLRRAVENFDSEATSSRLHDGSQQVRSADFCPVARLPKDPKDKSEERVRLPPDHWRIPRLPKESMFPPKADVIDHRQALTKWYNSQLTYMVSNPVHPSHQALLPLHTDLKQSHLTEVSFVSTADQVARKRPPSPGSALYQLRHVLHHINKLEKHRNFKPDYVTANIILKCWLRCAAGVGQNADEMRRWRWISKKKESGGKGVPGGSKGKEKASREAWKKLSDLELGKEEVRDLFKVLTRIMSTSISAFLKAPTSQPQTSTAFSASTNHSQEALDLEKHVRPFCKLMKRAMKAKDDREGYGLVVAWQKGVEALYRGVGGREGGL